MKNPTIVTAILLIATSTIAFSQTQNENKMNLKEIDFNKKHRKEILTNIKKQYFRRTHYKSTRFISLCFWKCRLRR